MARTLIIQAGHWRPNKQPRPLGSHQNPGLEVVYVAAGAPVWHTDGRVERVPPGSVFFTLPWQEHGSVRGYEPGVELSYVVLSLDRAYARPARRFGFHPALGLTGNDGRRIARLLRDSDRHTHRASAAVAWLLPRLVDESLAPAALGARPAAAALARALVVELARCIESAGGEGNRASEADRRVAALLAALPERCDEPWTLASMAAACGLGRTRFTQIVREQTGAPPIMALNRVRVQKARQLLARPELSITDVAFACGFGSAQYFARVFREYTGVTATDARRTAQS